MGSGILADGIAQSLAWNFGLFFKRLCSGSVVSHGFTIRICPFRFMLCYLKALRKRVASPMQPAREGIDGDYTGCSLAFFFFFFFFVISAADFSLLFDSTKHGASFLFGAISSRITLVQRSAESVLTGMISQMRETMDLFLMPCPFLFY